MEDQERCIQEVVYSLYIVDSTLVIFSVFVLSVHTNTYYIIEIMLFFL